MIPHLFDYGSPVAEGRNHATTRTERSDIEKGPSCLDKLGNLRFTQLLCIVAKWLTIMKHSGQFCNTSLLTFPGLTVQC